MIWDRDATCTQCGRYLKVAGEPVRAKLMSVDFSVNGKHVLITGGTGGIGSAFAEAFLGGGAVVTCAGRAVFLASPAASIVTGVTIAADAGYSVT